MKTAISLPDALFEEGEKLARELGVSRSGLYATAIAEYVARHRRDDVRQRLDAVYANESGGLDPLLAELRDASLPEEPW